MGLLGDLGHKIKVSDRVYRLGWGAIGVGALFALAWLVRGC